MAPRKDVETKWAYHHKVKGIKLVLKEGISYLGLRLLENGGQSLHIKSHRTIENLWGIYIQTMCYINKKFQFGR